MAFLHDNNDDKEHLEKVLLNTPGEPLICRHFGCGKKLDLKERLYGDQCEKHAGIPAIDIMKVLKFK